MILKHINKLTFIFIILFLSSCKNDFIVKDFEISELDENEKKSLPRSISYAKNNAEKEFDKFIDSLKSTISKDKVIAENNIPSAPPKQIDPKNEVIVQKNNISRLPPTDITEDMRGLEAFFANPELFYKRRSKGSVYTPISDEERARRDKELKDFGKSLFLEEDKLKNENQAKYKEIYDKKLDGYIKKIVAIKHNFIILNKSKQIIENGYLTIRINFKYDKKEFNYIKPYYIPLNKLWKPNEKFSFNNVEVLNESRNYNKSILIHEPLSVVFEVYLKASNNVGYTNSKYKQYNFINNYEEGRNGQFFENSLNEKLIEDFGVKIYESDITKIYKEIIKEHSS